MDCKKARKNLMSYHYNELDQFSNSEIQEHLSHCTDCTEFYKLYNTSFTTLKNSVSVLKANEFLFTRIEQKLNNAKNIHSSNPLMVPFLKPLLYPVIVLAILLGIWLGKTTFNTDNSKNSPFAVSSLNANDQVYYNLSSMQNNNLEDDYIKLLDKK